MPYDVTALDGEESRAEQFPISLVQLAIPGHTLQIHDSDGLLYLDPTTTPPGVGLLATDLASGLTFTPWAGLQVPEIETTDQQIRAQVSITLANLDQSLWDVIAADAYREQPASIWQGNIRMGGGVSPWSAVFVGAVNTFAGTIEYIGGTRRSVTVRLRQQLYPVGMTWPYNFYTPVDFVHMPVPGAKIIWGFDEREL